MGQSAAFFSPKTFKWGVVKQHSCSFAPEVIAIPRAGHQKVVAELEKGLPRDSNRQTTLALLQSLVKADLVLSRV